MCFVHIDDHFSTWHLTEFVARGGTHPAYADPKISSPAQIDLCPLKS